MAKELSRIKDGNKILFCVAGFDQIVVDYDAFTPEMKEHCGVHGTSQKVGDSAAGKKGQEAYDAIKKTANSLLANVWTEKAEATPKVAINEATIDELVAGLSPFQAEQMKANLASIIARQQEAKGK